MPIGDKMLKAGLKGDTPRGVQSVEGARNVVQGVLKWAMTSDEAFLSAEEVVDIISDIVVTEDRREAYDSIEHRVEVLSLKRDYFAQRIDRIDSEIDRLTTAQGDVDEH